MIFLSHNHTDKEIIEPIACKLAEIFGREKVFYDSWSMQPGDGIIDKMNEGLQRCTHFFFFVSEISLKSQMVKMEWQNAIFKSTKGNCKVIPIRLGNIAMPALLGQSLYIDLYNNGIDATIGQIVNVIQGNTTFTPSTRDFSNLSFVIEKSAAAEMQIKIVAKFYLEPIASFLVLVQNKENELSFSLPNEGMFQGGFNPSVTLNDGSSHNAQLMKAQRGITPSIPLRIEIKALPGFEVKFSGLLHQTGENQFSAIPRLG